MLLSFRTANVLSLRDEQRLSFVTAELSDGSGRPTAVRENGKPVLVVPAVGIYGANASGKTNVLAALRLMRDAVLHSVSWVGHPTPVRRTPFALHPKFADEPSFYEVDIVVEGVRYTYGFEIDDDRVLGEWLHAYPKGRRQVWFERDEDDIRFPGEGLRGEKLELARRTRPDALFLTVAAIWNHEQLLPVHAWFRDNLWLISPEDDRLRRLAYTKHKVVRDAITKDRVTRLMAVADLGIVDIEVISVADEEIRLVHRAGDHAVTIDFAAESMGTQAWFALLGPLLDAFDRGTTVLVDELDASLHPAMAAEVIQMFESTDANPNTAQMLFTTHDATLLRTPAGGGHVLGRDAIWLTEKDTFGATNLYPLAGVRPLPRKDENLERGYLLGRYGGTPRVASGELARAVEEALA
ncbi:AAA family ATPase [Nocardia abscessus]|uniref:AAA family ATPase n=1 Tax=Nocardia abscessus TaxID=120957 RepID=UPI0024548C19|nr:ATP-binding protein [Nocardia abscessus]